MQHLLDERETAVFAELDAKRKEILQTIAELDAMFKGCFYLIVKQNELDGEYQLSPDFTALVKVKVEKDGPAN